MKKVLSTSSLGLLYQILSHAAHLAAHGRHCRFGVKSGPAADVLDRYRPFHCFQVHFGSPSLEPATPPVQFVAPSKQRRLAYPPALPPFNVSLHHSIPSFHTFCPFIRPMLRDGLCRLQVLFAKQYDALTDGKPPRVELKSVYFNESAACMARLSTVFGNMPSQNIPAMERAMENRAAPESGIGERSGASLLQ